MAAPDIVSRIAAYFGAKGLSDYAIAGILGNMQIESGFNTGALNGNEGAIGLVQWEGGRRAALDQFAQQRGTSETDLNTQLDFLWSELTGPYRGALSALQSAGSASEAAAAFDSQYEISSGSTHQQRMDAANRMFDSAVNHGFHGDATTPAGGASAGGGEAANLNPSQSRAALIQGAGALGGLLTTIPELKTLLDKAVSQGWSSAEFENAVTNSAWYRTHSDNVRQQIALEASDPATYQANLNKEIRKIQQMGAELGIPMNHQAMAYLAMQSLSEGGWDQQTLQNAVGALWGKSTGAGAALAHPTGESATIEQQIRQTYQDYGVPITNTGIQGWMQNILAGKEGGGTQSIDTVKQAALTAAKSMYAPFAQQLDSGMTMRQIADPYVTSMANLLELDPGSINFSTDPMVKKALQGTGATATGQPPTATPLWQFEQQVRSDPRWQYTVNAHNETAAALTKLGQDWGFAS